MASFKSGDDKAGAECRENDNVSRKAPNAVTLPDDLIVDLILPRLPVKTLIRSKSVSKLWLSAISTPEFAKLHLHFSSSSSRQFLIVSYYPPKSLFLPYDEMNNLKDPVDLDFDFQSCFTKQIQQLQRPRCHGTVEFVGTCNGLVCLYFQYFMTYDMGRDKFHGLFAICNPALHEYCQIPNPDSRDLFAAQYWFGYIPSIDDCKIVVLFSPENYYEFHVFSVNTGKWNRIYDLERVCSFCDKLSRYMMVLHNILYWCPMFLLGERPKHFIGFDLVSEQVKELPWMDWLNAYKGVGLFVVDGCLTLYCSLGSSCDVWTLKQHDNWGSWEKLFTARLEKWDILNVTSTGNFLVQDCLRERLKIIDLRKGTHDDEEPQREVYFPGYLKVMGAGHYVESLISPFGSGKSQ